MSPAVSPAVAAVRAWVRALPPATAFWIADIPPALRVAASEVSAAFDGDWPVACRVAGDFCWRTSREDVPARIDMGRWADSLAIGYAGAGAGFAGYSALHRLGWTTQIPARARIATVLGAPQLDLTGVRYATPSENLRRRELTWAETTLLEAILHARLIEPHPSYGFDPDPRPGHQATWAAALAAVVSGETLRRLGPGGAIRFDALEDVAAGEAGADVENLQVRLRDIAALIGTRI